MLKDKALTSLAVGDLLMERGFPDDAASRYYYAMYRAAVHALGRKGLRPESMRSGALEWDHSMVENNVSMCRKNPNHRMLYREMRRLRSKADYGDASVSESEIAFRVAAVHRFVKELAS
jgi:uncharacterized protein (UPF0332 family)